MNRGLSFNQGEEESQGMPTPSKICGLAGCTHDATHAEMKVSSGKGIQLKPASDVSDYSIIKGQTVIQMKQNYQFLSWFIRCAECLGKGIEKKRGKILAAGEGDMYT
jgi:hypothetical protein